MTSAMNVLEVEHLSIAFQTGQGVLPMVSDVSFSLRKGEILSLVGESGCGKSITCMTLARLLAEPPARIMRGSIRLTGRDGAVRDILALPRKELVNIRGREIAYIFQEPSVSLNPVFRVGDQIAEAIRLHRPEVHDVKKEVIRLLSEVGIPSPEMRCRAYPHEMSGGMLQRVMIAMALASDPAILVADEPTTALDVTIQAQILDLIRRLRTGRDMSVILVTHNLGIVSEMADRVCVMYAGRIVETAPVRELLDHPVHPYTRALMKAVPRLGETGLTRLSTIPGNVPMPKDFPKGCRFAPRCAVRQKLDSEQQKRCLECVPPTLECRLGHAVSCFFPETGDKNE